MYEKAGFQLSILHVHLFLANSNEKMPTFWLRNLGKGATLQNPLCHYLSASDVCSRNRWLLLKSEVLIRFIWITRKSNSNFLLNIAWLQLFNSNFSSEKRCTGRTRKEPQFWTHLQIRHLSLITDSYANLVRFYHTQSFRFKQAEKIQVHTSD